MKHAPNTDDSGNPRDSGRWDTKNNKGIRYKQ